MQSDDPLLIELLALYGLKGWGDGAIWSREDLMKDDIQTKYAELRPKLLSSKLPIKVVNKLLLDKVDGKDMNTLLTQASKLYGYKLESYDTFELSESERKRLHIRKYRMIKADTQLP